MNSAAPQKVTARHLARGAYLYVRQSTLHQVAFNTESSARQYALRQRALALGWQLDQIQVIDCDQGLSGSSAADREGFQRLVAEVGMGRAGIVLGLEVSRLARNSADWHRLLELCGLGGTLICDEDGLYDPRDFNDRLVLGLKGTMSEAELHFIRSRLRGGIISKAKRGELVVPLPVGLAYDPAHKVVLDPDIAVQGAIRHLFATFSRTGSARAVVQAFAAQELQFPLRVRSGPARGEIAWAPLEHWRVLRTLHNPRYAGVFFFGRHEWTPGPNQKVEQRTKPREEWIAFIPGAHPGYISLEEFEANQVALAANAKAHGPERAAGPAREGSALAQGLAICGRCGRRMTVRYHHRHGFEIPDYQCMARAISAGVKRCLNVPGAAVDEALGELAVEMLTPYALEAALGVQAELEARAEDADRLRRAEVERARQRADLARRRYLGVDPSNRLVADTLEADWNDSLRELQDAQDRYDRASASGAINEEQKAKVRSLAADFPRMWQNPLTLNRDRKQMIRLLVQDVTIDKTDQIHLHVRFRGGQTKSLAIPIPPNGWEARQTEAGTLALLDRLLDDHTDAQAAQALNDTGLRTGTGQAFSAPIVVHLRKYNGLLSHYDRLRARGLLTTAELAERLGVSTSTIKAWRRAGMLVSHQANDKNERLFEVPEENDPRLVKQQGAKLSGRVLAPSAQGGAV